MSPVISRRRLTLRCLTRKEHSGGFSFCIAEPINDIMSCDCVRLAFLQTSSKMAITTAHNANQPAERLKPLEMCNPLHSF